MLFIIIFPPLHYQIALLLLPASAYVCQVLWKNLFRKMPQNIVILLSRYCEFIELRFKNGKHQNLILTIVFFFTKKLPTALLQADIIRNF